MKKILSIAIAALMLSAQPVMAQTDAKAKTILEGVSKKINSLKTLKANFALTLAGKTKDTKKGLLLHERPKVPCYARQAGDHLRWQNGMDIHEGC